MTKTTSCEYSPPSSILSLRLREKGFSVQRCWRVKGPENTEVTWMEAFLVHESMDRPGAIVIVQTFKDGGWNAYVPATKRNTVEATVEAVAAAI